jgi:hypothetical protein
MKQPPQRPDSNQQQKTIEEQIRRRAYQLYVQRGREDGHDLEDWLAAEAEITAQAAAAVA